MPQPIPKPVSPQSIPRPVSPQSIPRPVSPQHIPRSPQHTSQVSEDVMPQNVVNLESPPNLSYPVRSRYSQGYIDHNRKLIHDAITRDYLGGNPNFEEAPNVLAVLFSYYDKFFFDGQLTRIMTEKKARISFDITSRLTKSAGYCTVEGCEYTIKISRPVILGTFRKGEKFQKSNGIQCYDRLECLMNVFEHELTHFVVDITHGHTSRDRIYSDHGLYFRELVGAYFGHTKYKHELIGRAEVPGNRENFRVGDLVTYRSNKGDMVTGFIDKLNPKRAVIGNKAVPYSLIQPVDAEQRFSEAVNNLTISVNRHNPSRKKETPQTTDDRAFKVGDILTVNGKKGPVTDRLTKINPKTYDIGGVRAYHSLARRATQAEIDRFLQSPQAKRVIKTRDDFYLGQQAEFTESKTGRVITGHITKLNPTRAVIQGYNVPYSMLRAT